MKRTFVGYRIAAHYRNVTIWEFKPNGALLTTMVCRPNKEFERFKKYQVVAERIESVGLKAPEFIQLSKEPVC